MSQTDGALVIVPRTKQSDGIAELSWRSNECRAVRLDTDMLRNYFVYPLGKAAKALGLCETSLKRFLAVFCFAHKFFTVELIAFLVTALAER